MKCPECNAQITKKDIVTILSDSDDEYDFIEINVFCSGCKKPFFGRIASEDLILTVE